MPDKKHPIYNMSKDEILHKLLKKELGYYQAILEITKQEHELFQAGKIKSAMMLVKQKNILLSCVDDIEKALPPLKKWWREREDKANLDAYAIQDLLDTLDSTLKELLEWDEKNQELMKEQLLKLKKISESACKPK